MGLIHTLKFIAQHPYNRHHTFRAWWRFVLWQLRSRLTDKPLVYNFTDKAKLLIAKGMTGATGNLYCGLHEFHEMGFLLHLLREEDTFLDVGANVGTYTVLASAHIGAKSIAVEPVPQTYAYLMNNIDVNRIADKVTTYNMAMGSSTGEVAFTNSLDTTNHVAQPGEPKTLTVPVKTIDAILENHTIPTLIKIDVEGYESEVIKGAVNTLKEEQFTALIIELGGIGERYGFDESLLQKELLRLGFVTIKYNAFTREITNAKSVDTGNVIFVRNLPFVKQRVLTAPKVLLPEMAL